MGISSTNIHLILHEYLAIKKIRSRWISQKAQKKIRVDWCKEMLEKYDGGASKNVNKIVTGDESWICAYEPDTKQQSSVMLFSSPKGTVGVFKNHVWQVSLSEWKNKHKLWL